MIIIHGEDTVSSRNQLNELIQEATEKNQNIKRLEAKEIDTTALAVALDGLTLFGEQPLVVIEGLFSLPKSKNKDNLLALVSQYQDSQIVLYQDKQVGSIIKKTFAKSKFYEHKLPSIIFTFLDSLKPAGAVKSLTLLERLEMARVPTELIFAMLVRQVRLLILALEPTKLKISPWQKNKLIFQAQLFGEAGLLKLHHDLYHIDKGLKTGVNPLDLSLQLFNLISSL